MTYEYHPFANIFPMIDERSFQELKSDIAAHGMKEPGLLFQGKILDGRNRYRAACELGMEMSWQEVELGEPDEIAAFEPLQYVLSLNLYRRHLTTSQRAMVAASIADLSPGGDRKSEDFKGQNCTLKEAAEKLKVSERTVKSAKVVIASGDDELIEAVKAGDIKVAAAVGIIKDRKPHVSQNSGDNEWYTPQDYIAAGRDVLGGIDLDPATSATANEVVNATSFFTVDDDGLSKAWSGSVWLNPPYSKDLCGSFIEKLVDEYSMRNVTQALVLTNNATETQWFQMAARASTAICFPDKRVKFWKPDGSKGQPLQGQAVFYFGDDAAKFAQAFAKFGEVVARIGGAA